MEGTQDILTQKQATESELRRRDLRAYRILSFATHGLLANEGGLVDEPALALTMPDKPAGANDGFLTASEILELKLDADLVILSACNTGTGDGRPQAEGLSGLANSFYAGARQLVVTHWSIPDEPSAELMIRLMSLHAKTPANGWAKALQQAALELLDGNYRYDYAHPGSWAGYFAVGSN